MTTLLEQAISIAARLSEREQDAIAAKIQEELDRIDDSALWQQKFEGSKYVLEALYDEGIAEYNAGRTKPIGKRDPVLLI